MKFGAFSLFLSIVLLYSQSVLAKGDSFIVKNIEVKGLQRISAGTVYNYLQVNKGDSFAPSDVGPAIRSLFKTGFFTDVIIGREEDTLVIELVERPSIAKIIIDGNEDLSSEELLKALKNIGLSEGKVFNQQILDKVEMEMRQQYFNRGKYGVKIDTEVAPLTRNRVGVKIKIAEGQVAKIKLINVVGNSVFKDDELLGEFELDTTNLLSFYLKDDQYSKQKLGADLERLKSYYLDRGYIQFSIESTQVSITPDKKEIFITVNVKEGALYKLNSVKLTGNLVVDPEELAALAEIGPEEVFSRKQATLTSNAISERLGEEGYAFANVNMVPDIDDETKTVDMTFFVDPGKRVYVKSINAQGNTKTRDEVIRREMRQMESSWASTQKIERSKQRLERLGFFEEVSVETPPVVGADDQIDVNFKVTERASGNLQAGVGFSQTQGLIFNARVSENNIFGTGKRIGLEFNNSDVSTVYRFDFQNPYFTVDGVSSGFNLGYSKTDAVQANISNYTTDVMYAGINFGMPVSEYDRISLNLDAKYTKLRTGRNFSREIIEFLEAETGETILRTPTTCEFNGGCEFQAPLNEEQFPSANFLTFPISVGWVHDTLDRAVFPTDGEQIRLTGLVTVPGSDLQYYKASFKNQFYFPLAKDLTLRFHSEIAYADGYGKSKELPFFENYYAGGVNSVRGYNDNTLGPRDTRLGSDHLPLTADGKPVNGSPLGGSTKIVGGAELLFPVPFFTDNKSVRLGAFFDAGSVSDNFSITGKTGLRYSAGVSGEWLSPFGAISVSFALPLNKQDGDNIRMFQFTFGSGF